MATTHTRIDKDVNEALRAHAEKLGVNSSLLASVAIADFLRKRGESVPFALTVKSLRTKTAA